MQSKNVNKAQWIEMFRAIGLSDEQMVAWHKEFEKQNPAGHQEFLQWIAIEQDEIVKIRAL